MWQNSIGGSMIISRLNFLFLQIIDFAAPALERFATPRLLTTLLISLCCFESHGQETLTNGGNHPGTIAASKTNTYTFTGNSGDAIVLRVGATNVVPRIDLYGPTGALLTSA